MPCTKIPFSPLPFMSLLRSCFFALPARTLLRIHSCRVLYCFPVQMCFLCGDFSQGECFFFSSCRRFPQTLFHIHKHVYEGLAPVLTSFELLHGTLPFLFKAPFFITLFLFPLIHDELPRGAWKRDARSAKCGVQMVVAIHFPIRKGFGSFKNNR